MLVVEDDRAARVLLALVLLDELGLRVVQAGDGREALTLAGRERPDLVVLDMMLPRVDGPAVCRRLKADPATAAVPVIGMSAAMTRAEGIEVGCDAFLVKPFDLADFVALVRGALLRADRAEEPKEPRPGSATTG